MTEDERYEIATLAEAEETARMIFQGWQMHNTPTDPVERAKSAISYRLAETELIEAQTALRAAQGRIATKVYR